MTLDEKREHLAESLKLLATHEPFRQFMGALEQLKSSAVQDAVRMDVVDNPYKISACLGEIRAYLDIAALVGEYAPKNLE